MDKNKFNSFDAARASGGYVVDIDHFTSDGRFETVNQANKFRAWLKEQTLDGIPWFVVGPVQEKQLDSNLVGNKLTRYCVKYTSNGEAEFELQAREASESAPGGSDKPRRW